MAILRLGQVPPVRYASNPIISLAASTWYTSQIYDPNVLFDPSNSANLFMYVSGMASPVQTGEQSIGRFSGTVANPYSWSSPTQVLTKTGSGWEQKHVRLGCIFYDGGTYYNYYTGTDNSDVDSIGLATSTDGTSFTRSGSNPILTADGQGRDDGTHVSQPWVVKEGSSWTMIYSYRNSALGHPAGTLPGYRYATSSDGVSWTKGGSGDVLTTSPLFGEQHQVVKINGLYYLIYEAGTDTFVTPTRPFRIYAATSGVVTGPYTAVPQNPILAPSGVVGATDRYHVATPFAIEINGVWRLFYCGAPDHDQPYGTNTWPMCIADFPLQDFCAGSRGRGR